MATAVNHNESGPILRAAYEGDISKVKQLLLEGVPVDITNQAGLQALHFAAKTGNVDLATELIQHGAVVNAPSLKGNTPLHVAALLGQTDMVKLLLKHDANVNLQSECNGEMFTPLYMAAQIGNQEIVMLLLANGADPALKTQNGSTARDVAYQQGHQAVAELLEEYERALVARSQEDLLKATAADDDSNGGKPKGIKRNCPVNPSYQDVIPSPKQSPLKTKPTLGHNHNGQ